MPELIATTKLFGGGGGGGGGWSPLSSPSGDAFDLAGILFLAASLG